MSRSDCIHESGHTILSALYIIISSWNPAVAGLDCIVVYGGGWIIFTRVQHIAAI